jgi:hypothetical protein
MQQRWQDERAHHGSFKAVDCKQMDRRTGSPASSGCCSLMVLMKLGLPENKRASSHGKLDAVNPLRTRDQILCSPFHSLNSARCHVTSGCETGSLSELSRVPAQSAKKTAQRSTHRCIHSPDRMGQWKLYLSLQACADPPGRLFLDPLD